MEDSKLKSIESAKDSIKEIIVIVSGLAFTMTIILFFTKGEIPKEYTQFLQDPMSIFIFILVMISILRFCYGNLRHLDESFLKQELTEFDYIFSLIEPLVFCIMSLYQTHFLYFFSVFSILLCIDVVWFFEKWTWKRLTTEKEFNYQRIWIINNLLAAFALFFLLAIYYFKPDLILTLFIFVVAYLNTIIDFKMNWKVLYFPKSEESEA